MYLAQSDVSFTERSRRESFAVTKQWTSVFAQSMPGPVGKVGSQAVSEWLAAEDENLILLFLSEQITAFPISKNSRPCLAFDYVGPKVDVSDFHDLEFAVFPATYRWTLVHTHEDYALGGPYFIRAAELDAAAG